MAINDANRSRKTYSFFRAAPVPIVAQSVVIVEGPGGDMVVNPIQNVRFLDPEFAGDGQNGSIVTPYSDPASFFTEIEGSSDGWQMLLPGNNADDAVELTVTGSLANGSQAANIVFQGIGKDATHVTVSQIAPQLADTGFSFRDMTCHSNIHFQGNHSNALHIEFENVKVTDVVSGDSSGTYSFVGTLRLINCEIDDVSVPGNFGDPVTITADGCTFGTASAGMTIRAGILRNCVFREGSLLTVLDDETVTLIGTSFGGSCQISVSSNQTIIVDNFTYENIRRNVTFPGGFSGTPVFKLYEWCTVAADIIHEGTITLEPGVITEVNFGNPHSFDAENPEPQLSKGCIVTFKTAFSSSPFPIGTSIVASSIDGTGNILVEIANTSVDTASTGGVEICVVYLPQVSPFS